MPEQFPNSEFLFNRAEQCRSIARGPIDPMVRDRMISLALSYERIAKVAAKLKSEDVEIDRLDS